ncbi:glycoside hydrolase family 2 TIM barrel-domain containing protein [Flavivirga eckloniae]|uniref:Glycoside hydrolase family 2 n=1 Tax=Flavivirga eckloniae TaxID=1803846 RepID=A0A2K9PU04_9FLAO|nr:glycoside hydrolase family 2 TIM barrel-domain containing protein [Flavivirga eckloniae]AUP80545.1 glycoside hydrolase family 2 [Flavivirga eckloniae]
MRVNFQNLFLIVLATCLTACVSSPKNSGRVVEDFNFGWKFHLGTVDKASSTDFDDTQWRKIRLPHDWSVEHSFTQENAAGATAFLPGGIGWYRKTFEVPETTKDKTTWIEFDGAYSNSEVWINGHYLGKHPYGYTPFKYNLSEHLKYGEKNLIAIKIDRSAYIDNRWYPGSGIYRHVKLVSAHKLHIPQWGVFVSTPNVSEESADVLVQTNIENQFDTHKQAVVETSVYFNTLKVASKSYDLSIDGNKAQSLDQLIRIEKPNLWDTENPHLYQAVSKVYVEDILVDTYETTFGIRDIKFDKDTGFYLNGKNTLIKGVCLHHDGGLVGAAVPKGVWERRLKKLKESGCNAIRTAHNPPSEEFLDICDALGFLVQDEAFDEWNNPKDKRHNYNQQEASPLTRGYTEHFTEWAERDLKSMILRDRNHPSIIMWSIGNEIEWTYKRYGQSTGYWGETKVGDVDYYWDEPPLSVEQIKTNFNKAEAGSYNLAETAKKLSKWVKEVDTTRPVTANLVIPSVSNFSGYAEALDIVGLSYRQSVYDYCRKHYPDMTFLGTENWTRYHEWKPVLEKPFISGIFMWTGINYMGESNNWPRRGSGSGLLDFAGFEKPSYQMFKSLWSDEPHIHITTQTLEKSPYKLNKSTNQLVEKTPLWSARQTWGWQNVNEHWNYEAGNNIVVEVYTNQPEVELFLDNESLGTKKLSDFNDHILKWLVPYKGGKLRAKSTGVRVETTVQTAGAVSQLLLEADKKDINANAYDVVHFTVQLADELGHVIKNEEREVTFHIEGDARLLGVDNGSPASVQDYQNNSLTTSNGKALMILQSNLNPSTLKVKVSSGNIESKTIELKIN